MRVSPLVYICLIVLVAACFSMGGAGCANQMAPGGGLRDSLPPVMVRSSPPDSSKNIHETRITLTFDEYVQLDNIHDNLIVSPVPVIEPAVESKLRVVTIRLKDSLQPNTTYTLNFGKALKDVNEGNIAKNFSYIFTTGDHFDSLTLSGKVIMAESGRSDSTLIVMLHQHGDDSAVSKEKPRYVTRLDSSGNFEFRNLPPGSFYLYALEDQGGSHRYLSEKQVFAFADSAIDLQNVNGPIVLYAYAEAPSSQPLRAAPAGLKQRGGATEKRFRFQANLLGGQLDLLTTLVIGFEQPIRNLDTTKLNFSSDSSYRPLTGYQFIMDSTNKKMTLQYNWKENTLYHLIIDKDFAEDSSGKKMLKTDTVTFTTKKTSDYGQLLIRFRGLDLSLNPVLEFVQSNNIVRSLPLTTTQVSLPLVLPGDYEMRILNDKNKNGKWDPGQFFGKRLQPEVVRPVRRKINIKADWKNEFDVQL